MYPQPVEPIRAARGPSRVPSNPQRGPAVTNRVPGPDSRHGPDGRKTVMMIEDNEDSRLILTALLRNSYELVECSSGVQALQVLRGVRPDLILMDISLPEMDGVETLSRIRADKNLKEIPVIALTAHAMAGDRDLHLKAGFNDYISKPVVDEKVL